MPWLDEIKMAWGHSLIGMAPERIELSKFEESRLVRAQTEVASYGLFDTATPNFSTYYPEVTADDLAPKDADFVYPVFRALSEVTVHKQFNPVNFGQNGTLKKSMSLLKGQTLYPNHEASVGNELGAVLDVSWEESYKAGDIKVPAGINAKLKVDGKSNPKIARAVMMDPPSVHSTSVTVQFLWEKSHSSMTEEEFFRKLGTYDKDQRLIERIATDIKRYNELSLVSHGADPFAQRVGKDGKIVNPTFADNTYRLSAEQKKNQLFFFYDYKTDIISNSTIPNHPIEENSENMKPEVLALIAAMALGMKLTLPKENTEENFTENDAALRAALSGIKLEDAAEIARLKDIETSYNGIKDKVTPLETFQNTMLGNLKAEVITIYNKLTDNKPDAAMVALHDKSDFTALQAFKKTYSEQLDSKYPAKCGKCGSSEISRASAEKPGDKETPADKTPDAQLKAMVKSRQSSGLGVLSLYDTEEKN